MPNLIIAGPTKCGTTSVFDWLSEHPDAFPSKQKETEYFFDLVTNSNKSANFIKHGLSRYEDFFTGHDGQKIVFESSPSYLTADTALTELAKFRPQPIVVFIFRDPAERLYSEYKFSRYTTQTFQGDFESYCRGEIVKGRGCLLEKGKIVSLINRWILKFGDNKVLVYRFSDLKSDPRAFMKSLCLDIGIDPEFYSSFKFDVKNPTRVIRSRVFYRSALTISKLIPDRAADIIKPLYRRLNEACAPVSTKEDTEFVEKLRKIYEYETWEYLEIQQNK